MPAVLLTAPAADPIGLGDAKAFLRLDHDAEDDLVLQLIRAATAGVERLARRVLVAQCWRLDVKLPADGAIVLKPRPVREVEAVRLRGAGGETVTLAPDKWRFDWIAERLELFAVTSARQCEIDLAVGYGEPEDVPEPLRLAVRKLTADAYERRTGADGPPVDIEALVAPYRDLRL